MSVLFLMIHIHLFAGKFSPLTFTRIEFLVKNILANEASFVDAVFNQFEFFLVPRPLPGTYRTKKWQFALRYRTRLIYVYNSYNFILFFIVVLILLSVIHLYSSFREKVFRH